jgi:predicted GNAT family N-acyltransferase
MENSVMDFTIKYGCLNMNFEKVTAMLSKTYWSPEIRIEEIIKAAQNSALVVGVFFNTIQIGYSRVISDKTRFAYICDVIVDKDFRKNGAGQLMISSILSHSDMKDVYQWLLVTKDAQGVYAKTGFKELQNPANWMGIINTRPQR